MNDLMMGDVRNINILHESIFFSMSRLMAASDMHLQLSVALVFTADSLTHSQQLNKCQLEVSKA